MYLLENNQINLSEKFFIEDDENFSLEQHNLFFDAFKKRHLHLFLNPKASFNVETFQINQTSWQKRHTFGVFKSIANAKSYVNALTNDVGEYRMYRKRVAQEHNILSEWNILDLDRVLVENIHSCAMNKCSRFGACPTTYGMGCDIGIQNNTNLLYHIPIVVKSS